MQVGHNSESVSTENTPQQLFSAVAIEDDLFPAQEDAEDESEALLFQDEGAKPAPELEATATTDGENEIQPAEPQGEETAGPLFTVSYNASLPLLVHDRHGTGLAKAATILPSGVAPPSARLLVAAPTAAAGAKAAKTEEERVQERNKKGRERSLRTRRRNAARLKSLQDGCAFLDRENGVLRALVACLRAGDAALVGALLRALAAHRATQAGADGRAWAWAAAAVVGALLGPGQAMPGMRDGTARR